MEKAEYLSPEAWEQWHTELLQSTINRAYERVPFYREKMNALGIAPEDICSARDLSKLPFMTRKDLVENYPYGLFSVPLRDIVRIHTLRGGLVNPVALGYTSQDIERRIGLTARFLQNAGVKAEDIVQICLDPGLSLHGQELKEGAEHLGALVIPPDPISAYSRLRVMIDFKTTVLITTPSYGMHLFQIFREENMPLAALNLRLMILLGEPLHPETRRYFEQELDMDTRMIYGIFEASGPSMACECEEKAGLHLALDHFIPEIINPETAMPLGPGEEGELVITTVTARANPLIRFRTGDITSIDMETCRCGRTTWRMAPVNKRCDDLITVRGVKISPDDVGQLLKRLAGGKDAQFSIVLNEWKHLTQVEIRVAMNEDLFSGDLPELHNWIREIEEQFHEILGIRCRIFPVEREGISLSPVRS